MKVVKDDAISPLGSFFVGTVRILLLEKQFNLTSIDP